MIKMIGFDLDGTICDTISICLKAFLEAVSPYVDYELTEKHVKSTFGFNETGMIKLLVKEKWEAALSDFYTCYERWHEFCREPFPGIRETISFLKEKNRRIVLITGKGEKSCAITLQKLDMEHTFDKIMCGSEQHRNKAEAILALLEQYRVKKEEFVYIGDTISDIEACKQSGVLCCSAAWGTDGNLHELRRYNAEHTYESVAMLRQYLEQHIAM